MRPWPAAAAGWLLALLSRRPLASAPRWGEAVVEHEHALHVEALGDVGDELVRGRRKGAVAVEELPTLAACEQSAAVGTRCCGRAHTSGSWAWRPSALRSSAVTVWNGASAGTLNLVVLRMGASPVCLKLTITFPSLTAEAEDGIALVSFAPAQPVASLSPARLRVYHPAMHTQELSRHTIPQL